VIAAVMGVRVGEGVFVGGLLIPVLVRVAVGVLVGEG